MEGRTTVLIVRWIARGWSIASIAVVLAFLGGDESSDRSLSAAELVGFFFFPGCVLLGLALRWWREELGGAVVIFGLLGFYVWEVIGSGRWPTGPWFALLAAPGLLFLVARALSRSGRPVAA